MSNLDVQQRFVAAVFAGDAVTLTALCHTDFALEQGAAMPYAGTYRGAEGFLAFLGVFGETYDIEKLEPARDYAVSAGGPGFGALKGTEKTAMLGPELPEAVWFYDIDKTKGVARTRSQDGALSRNPSAGE